MYPILDLDRDNMDSKILAKSSSMQLFFLVYTFLVKKWVVYTF